MAHCIVRKDCGDTVVRRGGILMLTDDGCVRIKHDDNSNTARFIRSIGRMPFCSKLREYGLDHGVCVGYAIHPSNKDENFVKIELST